MDLPDDAVSTEEATAQGSTESCSCDRSVMLVNPAVGEGAGADFNGMAPDAMVRQLKEQLRDAREQLQLVTEQFASVKSDFMSARLELANSKEEVQFLNKELLSVTTDYENLLASSGKAVVFLDRWLTIRRYSPAMAEILNLTPSDIGCPFGCLHDVIDWSCLAGDLPAVLENLFPIEREVSSIKEGSVFRMRVFPYRTPDGRIDGLIVSLSDITQQKRMEEKREKLASFPLLNPNPVIEADFSGTVTFYNPATKIILNQMGLGTESINLFIPSDLQTVVHCWDASSEATFQREVQIGNRVYSESVFLAPRTDSVRIYAYDITERKQAEEALQTSEDRLKRAQEIAHLGSWELDLATDLLTWSDEVYRIFGLQPRQFGASYEAFLEVVHPDDRSAVDAAYSDSIRDCRDSYQIEHRIVRKDTGEVRLVHEKCEHLRDTSGKIIRSIGMVHDITERKRVEEALRESEQRVRGKLECILSPEGDLGDLDLADIVDVQSLHSLVLNFYELTRMPMGLIDIAGNVLVGVGWQEVCTKFHRAHPDSCRNCIESDVFLSAGVPHGEYKFYRCKNNMWDVATPIIVGDKHFGNLFMGQFLFEDEQLDYEFFKAQARRYGYDEEEYIAALETVPRLSRDTLNTGMAFFMELADILSKLGYGNLKLARSLAERDMLMEWLEKSSARLDLLGETAGRLLASESPQAIVDELCRKVMSFLDCHVFFNFLVEEGSDRLHLNACAGIPREEAVKIEWLDYGVAVCGCAAQDSCRIVAENISETPDPRTELVRSYGVTAYACHPLIAHGHLLGTLSFGTRSRPRFTDDELAVMKAVSDQVAIAMERKRGEEELQRGREELEVRVAERTAELARTVEVLRDEVHDHRVTEQVLREKEEMLLRLNRLYAVLSETGQAIVRISDQEELLHEICRIAIEHGGFRLAWVGMIDSRNNVVEVVSSHGETAYLGGIEITIDETKSGKGPTGIVLREGSYHICNDFLNDPLTLPWQDRARKHGIRASASIALMQDDDVIGALTLYSDTENFFDTQQVELIQQMGNDISFALGNLLQERLRREAEQALQEESAERLRAMEELRQKDQLLLQQSRQAAMGEMLGNIAHQWRQPLNSLGLIVQELPIMFGLGKMNKEYLENNVQKAKQVIFHMSQTIDDFRNFFTPNKAKVSFEIGEVIRKTLSLVENSLLSQRIKTRISIAGESSISGYPNEFSQVLLNILLNARDAFAEKNIAEPQIEIAVATDDVATIITVTDNAGGIPKEVLGRVFEPYFTTKASDKGTGIGLFMAKTIIEKNMNGTLSVSNTREGAAFRIEIAHAS